MGTLAAVTAKVKDVLDEREIDACKSVHKELPQGDVGGMLVKLREALRTVGLFSDGDDVSMLFAAWGRRAYSTVLYGCAT